MRVTLASDAKKSNARWLIQDLWPANGCGILGGVPKSRKTWMALSFAKAIATGQPFLNRGIWDRGRVLYLAGEDTPETVRSRLGTASSLVHCCFEPVRLDTREGLMELSDVVEEVRPVLVVVDPLVRFTRSDGLAATVETFAGLRAISNTHQTAVMVVHHMKKGGHGGQGLRGSSELHAWGDVNWYLDPNGRMEVEHRTAASWNTTVRLGEDGMEVAHPLGAKRREWVTRVPGPWI